MIKRLIHQIVIGSKRNDTINRCLNSWTVLEEYDFKIKVWNEEQIHEFVSRFYPNVIMSIKNARNYAEASDIARFLIIYHYGGIYIDWDIQLLDINKFIKIIHQSENGFLIIDPENETLASECFAATINEGYLKFLVENINDLFESGKREKFWTPQYSGPYRMRESYKLYNLHNNCKLKLIPVNDIFLYNYREIRLFPKRKVEHAMIHYWIHSWI